MVMFAVSYGVGHKSPPSQSRPTVSWLFLTEDKIRTLVLQVDLWRIVRGSGIEEAWDDDYR